MRLQTSLILWTALSLSVACRSTMPASGPAVEGAADTQSPLELSIEPAVAAAPGGQRLPLQFTLRNKGDQPVHTCLSSGRVVHLWGLDRQYAYTVAEQGGPPACTEKLDLAPHGARSWNEEMAIPRIAASSAKIVGFAQLVQPDCGSEGCQPVWLSATYSPFVIEAGATVPPMVDLRTGA